MRVCTKIHSFFQFNAWAIPCNNVTECDSKGDENPNNCNQTDWYSWVAAATLLSVCFALFVGVLKFSLFNKDIKDEFELQPLNYSEISILRKENRGRLALRLDEGGRDEANKVYQEITQDPSQKTWKIKVLILIFKFFLAMGPIASFYYVNYGSSIIASKNLSNEIKNTLDF